MKLARIRTSAGPRPAMVDGDLVRPLSGEPYSGLTPVGPAIPLADVTLLAPVNPRKIIAIARNYRAHAAELGNAIVEEDEPLFFLKPVTALLDPGGNIELPEGRGRIDYEGELALVIGKTGRHIPRERAREHILGVTCANDVTARAVQKAQKHFTHSKGYDTFCPVGPWIETDLDPTDLRIVTRLNDRIVQDGHTRDMVHPIDRILSHVSSIMTLEAGDLILTGTPAGVGPLSAGDTVEVTIDGIGTLSNRAIGDARLVQRGGTS